jgi:hypothetical protein
MTSRSCRAANDARLSPARVNMSKISVAPVTRFELVFEREDIMCDSIAVSLDNLKANLFVA